MNPFPRAFPKLLLSLPVAALLFACGARPAVAEGRHPLDLREEKALESAMSTQDMVEALDASYRAWDKELNRAYDGLRNLLDAKGKAALRKAELAWVAYKEAQESGMARIFAGGAGTGGTIDRVNGLEFAKAVVRDRALELCRLLGEEHDGESGSVHPIDAWYEAQPGRTGSTGEMNRLNDAARVKWDAEMNRVYALLQGKLDKDGKAALRDIQRKWLAWRDAKCAATGPILSGGAGDGGTMDSVRASAIGMETTRKRALELATLLANGEEPEK